MKNHRPNDARGRAGGGSPRLGLRGSLDVPVATIDNPARVEVAGWVHHAGAEVLLVSVLVDGELVGTAERPSIPRPDVREIHEGAPLRTGWSTVVSLGRTGRHVSLSAHALVALPPEEDEVRRIVLVEFAERELEVRDGGRVRGEVDLPDRREKVDGTTVQINGTADVSPGLARVEVSVAGSAPVRARHSLPSGPDWSMGPEGTLRGFSAIVEVPAGSGDLDVQVTVVASDDSTAQLPASVLPRARASEQEPGDAQRQAVLLERFQRHVTALRSALPAPALGRVLVAAHDLGIGGAQGYLDDLMHGLHVAGIEFCVVAGADGPLRAKIESAYSAPVLVLGAVPTDGELLETRLRTIAGFAIEHGARACLANTLVSFPAVVAAQRLGIRTMWALHESFAPAVFWHEYLRAPAHPTILAATHQALSSCDEILFEAGSTRDLYADLVPGATASLVPYGLDIAAFDEAMTGVTRAQARRDLGVPIERRALICVGSVEPRKGQLALARAFGRLDASARAVTSLYLVGASDNGYSRALRDFVHDSGLDDVHVVDADPDILRWYAAADVLVSASDVESMPRTMLETMLAGRPVAATAAFGVGELVEDGVTGWLCEPGDLKQLTELLARAARADQRTLDHMGEAGRARVVSDHSASGYVEHVQGRLEAWLSTEASR